MDKTFDWVGVLSFQLQSLFHFTICSLRYRRRAKLFLSKSWDLGGGALGPLSCICLGIFCMLAFRHLSAVVRSGLVHQKIILVSNFTFVQSPYTISSFCVVDVDRTCPVCARHNYNPLNHVIQLITPLISNFLFVNHVNNVLGLQIPQLFHSLICIELGIFCRKKFRIICISG